MRHIHLSYYERISLWNLIGNHQVPRLREASVLLRIIEKVRPTDLEVTDTELVQSGNQMSWKVPYAGYGDHALVLEDEEAAALAQVLEVIDQPVRVADAAWMCRLADSLSTVEKHNG